MTVANAMMLHTLSMFSTMNPVPDGFVDFGDAVFLERNILKRSQNMLVDCRQLCKQAFLSIEIVDEFWPH